MAAARNINSRLGKDTTTIRSSGRFQKSAARWFPYTLTDGTRFTRVFSCQFLLLRPHRKEFLDYIITGETRTSRTRKTAETSFRVSFSTNSTPHVAKETHEKLVDITDGGFRQGPMPHLLYSPDLAPSDYHLFQRLKAFLAKKIFIKFEEVERAVSDFFDSQSLQFWEKGIADLHIKWDTVVVNNGDYIID